MGGGLSGHDFLFEKIIAPENIFAAWREFRKGKMKKSDVLAFAEKVEENLFCLISDLENGQYAHGQYIRFIVCDPKRREIAKAPVRDRVLHHAIYRVLTSMYDQSFIFDSYSSRKEKGTHRAVKRFRKFAQKISQNHTKNVWVLQADIRKFFDSVDHAVLLSLLRKKIKDEKIIELLDIIIRSYEKSIGKGIPLGNLTSQIFSNIYLDALDRFVKRELRVKYYLRYADDFVIINRSKEYLGDLIGKIENYLWENLDLRLHPKKVKIEKWGRGIDFLGYVSFPHHFVLRTKTKKRMLKKIKMGAENWKNKKISRDSFNCTVQSCLGILRHCCWHGLVKNMKKIIFKK